ncbi:PP2C family protein-serine/threonine phosphatase [Paenibacillus sp. OAS669]|uniref:PP2C family protein-serine/threonine phosphatase n=1 Tax=Paenibacillus sp. OAS669 TaxID=2663821 RepID=UPI00178BB004|nr:PP2C family serine/threonine-protein phosphatase [Paenibacillus sp. OAS669]MBE1441849.1 protein phosphatase [Paenibacillus sp. OAS669]
MRTTFAVHWHYGIATHSGWFRMMNDDRSLLRIGTTEQGDPYAVAVIADGVGGIGDGSRASDAAMDHVRHWLDNQLPKLLKTARLRGAFIQSTKKLLHEINVSLLEMGNHAGSQMSTTLTLLFLLNETYILCHIGDCRVYYFHRQRLKQLTKDHSWVAEQVRKRKMTPKQARKHPHRHVLLQCLGVQKELNIQYRSGFYSPNSLFLLCTDGLYDRMSHSKIEYFLKDNESSELNLQQVSDLLVDKALDQRANDNISVLLLSPLNRPLTLLQRIRDRLKHCDYLFPADWRKWYNKRS